jgi:hypothetical protein
MTNKHSLGPWSIDKEKKFYSGYSRKSLAITDANGYIVLLFDPSDGEYSEALNIDSPNAKLISAAPELLDALKEIVDAADGDGWNQLDASFKKARAAIKKATGETK